MKKKIFGWRNWVESSYEAKKLKDKGLSIKEIANSMNLHHQTVKKLVNLQIGRPTNHHYDLKPIPTPSEVGMREYKRIYMKQYRRARTKELHELRAKVAKLQSKLVNQKNAKE